MKKTITLSAFIIFTIGISARAQYCMLPGRTSYSQFQPGIKNFKLNTINRVSSNVENPLSQPSIVVTTDTTTLERGKTYTVTIVHTRDSTVSTFENARNNIRVWVDWNNDKDFDDAGETVISDDTIAAGTYTKSFTVPATQPSGVVRLRATAKMSKDAGHSIPTPCDMPKDPIDYHGEMEDYSLRIVFPTSVGSLPDLRETTVYPNPSGGLLTVSMGTLGYHNLSIDIFDVTGKFIGNLLQEKDQTAISYNFDLATFNLQSGVYFIKIQSNIGNAFQKLILAK